MRVRLVAHTAVIDEALEAEGFDPGMFDTDADILAEFSGRACYQSFHRPNPATAQVGPYLEHTNRSGHFSILEHASVTFYVTGVSRALTHELVRHRHLSYSQLSQRYVDAADARFVIPPAVRDRFLAADTAATVESVEEAWQQLPVFQQVRQAYAASAVELTEMGLPRKQARESARAVLPNATETRIVVTGNIRAWRDFLAKRWHVAADAEIREMAGAVLGHLRRLAPASVQDIPVDAYGTSPLPEFDYDAVLAVLDASGLPQHVVDEVIIRLAA